MLDGPLLRLSSGVAVVAVLHVCSAGNFPCRLQRENTEARWGCRLADQLAGGTQPDSNSQNGAPSARSSHDLIRLRAVLCNC